MKTKFTFLLTLVFMCCSLAMAQTTVKGTVVSDTDSEPMIGVAILEQGTSNGTITDFNGEFTLKVTDSKATLRVSYVGYATQVVNVGNATSFSIRLKEDSQLLDDVVVIGYGIQKKSDVTGAIASVKGSDLENRTTSDVAQALQGKAAGVQIINSSGAPGSGASIQIRGYSSNSKTTPLMIVDGLKVNDISYLDPEMIASIEVLKDAASAAIYGVEAGNGVILITTKSGTSTKGSGRVFYSFQHSLQNAANLPDVMNAKQYMEYLMLSGAATESDFKYDGRTDTKWSDVLTETGHQSRHTVGFEGANENGKLYASLSYSDNNGIIVGNKDTFSRLVGQINAEYKVKPWLTVGANVNINRSARSALSESDRLGASVLSGLLIADPTCPPVYDANNVPQSVQDLIDAGQKVPTDANGNVYGVSIFSDPAYLWNPLVLLQRRDTSTKNFFVRGTAYANFNLLPGLVFTSRLGYQGGHSTTSTYDYEVYTTVKNNQAMAISGSTNTRVYYQLENFANYTKTINKKHTINAMVGMSYQQTNTDDINASANALSYDSPNFHYLSNAVNTAQMSVGGEPIVRANMSYFGRLGYTFANKYNVQANFRADAYDSSKLHKSKRWGYFPSISAGWTVSNEKFMDSIKEKLSLDMLKIRASWGINGNVNALGNYQYASTLQSSTDYGNNLGQGFIVGVRPSTVLPNPDIKWETSRQIDLGVDMRFFNDRLTVGIDWYNKDTHNLLTSTTAPGNTGAEIYYVNAGLVNNHGTELELGWKDNIGDFTYSITGNLSTVHNKVKEGTSADRVPGQKIWSSYDVTYFEEGYPLWYLRTFVVDHIDQQTGAAVYKDLDDNGEITAEDRTMTGSGIPDYTYGITVNMAYKGFDFMLLGSGAQGVERLYALNRADALQQNTLAEFYTQAWHDSNSTGYKYPKPNANDPYYKVSNMRVYDASFFKIKQIQFGYSLPKSFIKKFGMSALRAYVSLDDFFTFTSYPGLDPEVSHAGASTDGLGVDFGSYPISRKVVFGVNVSF